MAKAKTVYFCSDCGNEHPKWQGQCNGCRQWNTLVEQPKERVSAAAGRKVTMAGGLSRKPKKMVDVDAVTYAGFPSGLKEYDRVMGGNIPYGSVTLIAGEPGKGKSTILLQISGYVAQNVGKVLYCTGEESEMQVKKRALRFGINIEDIYIYNTEDIFEIEQAIEDISPTLVIVDSIQHIANPDINSELGSVTQVKNCTAALIRIAKTKNIAIKCISHVTKDDQTIAGPKKLEHMVDTVLFISGDKTSDLRILDSRKNRYGNDNEVGVFKMEEQGLVEILNPSEYLLSDRASDTTGSAVVCISAGRPMLIEVQALVAGTSYENAIPRRTSRGIERDRFSILTAVLEKRCGLKLGIKDIYFNVVGGMRLDGTSSDLGVAFAIYSSDKDIVIDPFTTVIGEIGLGGEIRPVQNIEQLVKEAERNGFTRFILPQKNLEAAQKVAKKIKLVPVQKVKEALDLIH